MSASYAPTYDDIINNPSGQNQVKIFFRYTPNKPLAIVSTAVYGLFIVYLTVKIFRSRSPKFLYILPLTAAMEMVGYLFRYLCGEFTNFPRFITMTLLLLLAPNFLALVNYKCVGDIIRLSNVETKAFYLKPKFVTWFFLASDIISFFIQGAGGAMTADYEKRNISAAVTLLGLGMQLIFFAVFAFITFYVYRNPVYQYHVEGQTNPKKKLAYCLLITTALIYVRSIYRVVSYASGFTGSSVSSYEWPFYVFEALVIAICFLVYCVLFIGNYLPKNTHPELLPTASLHSDSNKSEQVLQTKYES